MTTIQNFADANKALSRFYAYSKTTKYDTSITRELLSLFDSPQESFKTVHIAGTSGKTSTAYYCAALLNAAGYKTGLNVSPHVHEINERVQINLEPLPETKYCAALQSCIERIDAAGKQPSYFELTTTLAFTEFANQQVDYAVVEVGLGGVLDATNTIQRRDKTCVITDIGLDHTEILGDTLDQIATAKAGIIHAGNNVVMHSQPDEIVQVIQGRATEQGAELTVLPRGSMNIDATLPLFQQRNLSLAVAAINGTLARDGLPELTPEHIAEAAKVVVPARMQTLDYEGKLLIIDGSHNEQKIEQLMLSIKEKYPLKKIAALVGFVNGVDNRWQGGLDALLPNIESLIVVPFSGAMDLPKESVEPQRVVEYAMSKNMPATSAPTSAEGFNQLFSQPADLFLVVGSFYLLNHIFPLLAESTS